MRCFSLKKNLIQKIYIEEMDLLDYQILPLLIIILFAFR